jgi:hypothetical protein
VEAIGNMDVVYDPFQDGTNPAWKDLIDRLTRIERMNVIIWRCWAGYSLTEEDQRVFEDAQRRHEGAE